MYRKVKRVENSFALRMSKWKSQGYIQTEEHTNLVRQSNCSERTKYTKKTSRLVIGFWKKLKELTYRNLV